MKSFSRWCFCHIEHSVDSWLVATKLGNSNSVEWQWLKLGQLSANVNAYEHLGMFCNANLSHCQRTKYFKISVYSSSNEGWRLKLSISMLKKLLPSHKISVFDAPGAFVMLFWMLLKFFFRFEYAPPPPSRNCVFNRWRKPTTSCQVKCKFIWHSKVVSTTSQFTYRRDLKNVCTTRW